ncbi:UDP-N-acetylglucosamine 2-epimerase [Dyella humicola]|uniref:UDP-N-acetylglucosamine 2-epimerase n=1 Tax=Dyella humicola TaxID=2992126 RepID=UPI0022599909|nr:UDP-N-acetylglucosamine 2-epimerase [Dyella humicola]
MKVLRIETEISEAVDEGVVRVVRTVEDFIVRDVSPLLDGYAAYGALAKRVSPYGDGLAAARIVAALRRNLISNLPTDDMSLAHDNVCVDRTPRRATQVFRGALLAACRAALQRDETRPSSSILSPS